MVTKHLCFLLLLLTASKLFASDTKGIDLSQRASENCPTSFNNIQVHESGKLCQIFAVEFPASMIFHIPMKPHDVISFYKSTNPELILSSTIKERTLLKSPDDNKTLIISRDGDGTQVDILVKQKA